MDESTEILPSGHNIELHILTNCNCDSVHKLHAIKVSRRKYMIKDTSEFYICPHVKKKENHYDTVQ